MTYQMTYQDDVLHAILHGNLASIPEPPSRVVKVFVSSTKLDFEQERRQLHEVVFPELQRHCSALGVDVELLDPQQRNDVDAALDPYAFAQQMREIEDAHRVSLGCFLLCLVGNKYKPFALPASIDSSVFEHIYNASLDAGLDVVLLENWYKANSNTFPSTHTLVPVQSKYKNFNLRRPEDCNKYHYDQEVQNWQEESDKLVKIIHYGTKIAHQEGLISQTKQQPHPYLLSAVHAQLSHALSLSRTASHGIICFIRQFEGYSPSDVDSSPFLETLSQDSGSVEEDGIPGLQNLVDDVILQVHRKNVHYFTLAWQEQGVNPESAEHSNYLEKFGEAALSNLKELVDQAVAANVPSWEELPPPLRKAVQEVVRESQTHLCNCRSLLQVLGVSQSLDTDCGPVLQIQNLMLGEEDRVRHAPIIVCGSDGCGKSTLLSQVFTYCPEWLGSDVVRIVRHVGHSPCSTYTPELLRNLCLHISLVFGFEISPKHHSYELGKLSIWFQDLIKMVENTTSDLVIVLDDLHLLRSPPSNQAAILGWLPWNLPPNVHIICSIAEEAVTVLGLLKSRLSTGDNFVYIPTLNDSAAFSMLQCKLKDAKYVLTADQWQTIKTRLKGHTTCLLYLKLLTSRAKTWPSWKIPSDNEIPLTVEEMVSLTLQDLEDKYGLFIIRKLATYLTCTHFGLREPEILELLSSTEYEGPRGITDDESRRYEFTTTSWFGIKEVLGTLLKEYYVDSRPYLHWSHQSIRSCAKQRYLASDPDIKACHADLASAFNLSFLSEKDEKTEDNRRRHDWSDMLREIDELWYHLFLSDDGQKLKQSAICNVEFLLTAVRGASISYIRSILEIVRSQLLDWEVELLYNMTKQAVDVVSQDPLQLATEILNWLKPFSDGTSEDLDNLVNQTMKWCTSVSHPFLIPQNTWLSLTLPPQVTVMTCPTTITRMVTTPDSQYVLITIGGKVIEMYHLASKAHVRTFTGHKANVTCLHITKSARWLVTGSEDTDVIIWDLETGTVKRRLSHHIAGVLCVTTTNSEDLVLSGSEIGVAIVSKLDTGQVVQRIENHRGMITCVAVNNGDDIFATASTDKTICIWCLEDMSLLNTITLPSAINMMLISEDSTFLLLACDDHKVHVRSLTTGSDIHCLQGYSGDATCLCFAHDNCRCVVGSEDGKCYIFDIHSAKLLQTLSGHSQAVTGLQAQPKDRFLVSAGGNKVVVWNFYVKRTEGNHLPRQKTKRVDSHREPVTCIAVSRDGSLAVSGSKDCLVKVWQLSSGETHTTLEGHTGPVSCVAFAPHGLFTVSGSEDNTLRVWGLTLGLVVSTFKEHQSKITAVAVTSDSRRVLSVDVQGMHRLWQADSAVQLVVCSKPSNNVTLHANVVFSVGGKNENSVKFWSVFDVDSEKSVSHSDAILCYTVTYDCHTIVTGSQDMSLKVWEVSTGKLTQVLVGHEGPVTCVAVAPFSPSLVVSGSADCNLIVWDMTTGNDNFTLRGHTESVKSVKLTLDGTVAISGSDDNTLQIWNVQDGHRISMFDIHQSILSISSSLNISSLVIQLANNSLLPILRLHNNPSKEMTLDLPPGTPVSEESKIPGHAWRGHVVPKRVLLRGNLKREQSFDSFYWDMRSGSPKHEIGVSLDDFRKTSSPFGSREHLHLVGNVWDGSVLGRGSLPRGGAHADGVGGLPSKPKLPKHKILKKQHSMFACFPEFTQQRPQSPMLSPQMQSKDLDKKPLDFIPRAIPPRLGQGPPSRSRSLEEPDTQEDIEEEKQLVAVKDSNVCSVS